MRAIIGCLLLVVGGLLAVQALAHSLWILVAAAGLLVVGLGLLLRNPPPREDAATDRGCTTCRGAGTVYTDEYNDWRQTGPIRTIRELCPACHGLTP